MSVTSKLRISRQARDHSSGLEHIVSSQELCDKGLYVELGAFKYPVYLDFREVEDDQSHRYRQLAAHLGGRGVPSIEEALLISLERLIEEHCLAAWVLDGAPVFPEHRVESGSTTFGVLRLVGRSRLGQRQPSMVK